MAILPGTPPWLTEEMLNKVGVKGYTPQHEWEKNMVTKKMGGNEFLAKLGFGKQKSQRKAEGELADAMAQYDGLETPSFNRFDPTMGEYSEQEQSGLGGITVNPAYRGAQEESLAALRNIADRGGRSYAGDADLARLQSRGAMLARGQNDAIMQNARARGMAGSGAALMAQLSNSQNQQNNQSMQDMTVRGQNQNNEMNARMGAAGIGAGLEGTDYQRAANKANANDAINRFNASNKMGMSQFNAGIQNQGQIYNNNLAQSEFDNDFRKRGAKAGINQVGLGYYNDQTKIGAQQAGNLMGGATKIGSAYAGRPMAANDGLEVPGNPMVPGDSELNDTVPIIASPGEVVVPRTVAKSGDPHAISSFVMNPPKVSQDTQDASYRPQSSSADEFLKMSPNPSQQAPAPQPPMDRDQAMREYLQRDYENNQNLDRQDRDNSRRSYLAGNIGQGIEQMLTSNSVAHGGQPVDSSYYSRIADYKAPKRDSSSRDAIIKNYLAEKKQAGAMDIARANNDSRGAIADKNNKAAMERANLKAGAVGKGSSQQRMNALNQVHQRMVSPRGNNAVQRAMMDAYGAKKLNELLEKYKNKANKGELTAKELDKMIGIDVNLAGQELASIGGGGTGSDTSRAAVTAKTLLSDLNSFREYMFNQNPTPAELGEFMMAKKEYADRLARAAEEKVRGYQKDVFQQAKQLSPNDQELQPFKESFPFLFESDSQPSKPSISMIDGKQASGPETSPNDEAALKFMLEHPDDPRSARLGKILKGKGLTP